MCHRERRRLKQLTSEWNIVVILDGEGKGEENEVSYADEWRDKLGYASSDDKLKILEEEERNDWKWGQFFLQD